MLEAIIESGGPWFAPGICAALASAATLCVLTIVSLVRRTIRTTLVGSVVAFAVVPPMACFIVGLRAAGVTMKAALSLPAGKEQAGLIAESLSQHVYNGHGLANVLTVCGGLAALTWSLHLATRAHGPRKVLAALGLGVGGALAWLGIVCFGYSIAAVNMIAAVAEGDPSKKVDLLAQQLPEIADALNLTWPGFVIVVGGVAAIAMVTQLRARWSPGAVGVTLAGGLWLAGGALLLEAHPFAEENNAPPIELTSVSPRVSEPTLRLQGPDPVTRAPVINIGVSPARPVGIEGVMVSGPEELTKKLQQIRLVDEMMDPDKPFSGRTVITGDPDAPAAHLNHALAALQATGYDKGSAFAFLNPRAPLSRPYFGAVPLGPTESAANFSLNGDGDATVVTVGEGTLGELAAKVVKLREQGKTVVLERAEATPDPDPPDAVE